MKKDIYIALALTVVSNGLCALSQLCDRPIERYIDYQKNHRDKAIPRLEMPQIKSSGGGIDIFLASKDFDKKGVDMDG